MVSLKILLANLLRGKDPVWFGVGIFLESARHKYGITSAKSGISPPNPGPK